MNTIRKITGIEKSILHKKNNSLDEKTLNSKKNSKKSLSSKPISNNSKFKKFLTINKNNNNNSLPIEITIVPSRTNLYQGTDFNFSKLSDSNKIKKYFEYYDKKHNGSYFLGSKNVASLYGKNLDFSDIIYTTIPDFDSVNKPIHEYDDIYALYYNDYIRGSNIKYNFNNDLYLIDIGNIKSLYILFKIIFDSHLSKKEDYLYTLQYTCLYKCGIDFSRISSMPSFDKFMSLKPYRYSYPDTDDELVEIFKEIFRPYFNKNYGLNIDGWIYYQSIDNTFHNEILLLTRDKLIIKDIKTYTPTFYNLPTRKEFIESLKNRKVKNNKSIKYNTILSNIINIRPKSSVK